MEKLQKIMDEEQLKILEMVANKTITPEQAAKLLSELKDKTTEETEKTSSTENTTLKNEIKQKIYENEEQLDVNIELGVTNFKLFSGKEDELYKVEYSDVEGLANKVNFYNNSLQVVSEIKKPSKLDLLSLKNFVDPFSKQCFVELNPKAKLYMKVKFGGGKSLLDFSNLKLKRLRLSSGASDTKIVFNTPNEEELDYLKIESGASNLNVVGLGNANCPEMDLNLGACNATLDFSGNLRKNLYSEIIMRVGKLTLLVPKEFGVKIKSTQKLADFALKDFEVRDGFKVSKNIDEAEKVLEFRVDSTLAQVDLSWI